MRSISWGWVVLAVLGLPVGAGAQDGLADLLEQVDAAYVRREPGFSGPNIDRTVELLEQAARAHPDSYGVHWRLARSYFWKADGAPDQDVKSAWGRKAAEAGDRARELDPSDVRGHYYAAAGVGAWAQGMGILSALTKGMEGRFNERLDRALQLDPDYECAGPMIAKGRYHYELPWPKYDGDKSVEWLQKALEACPGNPRALLYLAEVHKKEGSDLRARRALERAQAIEPGSFSDPPEVRRVKTMLRAVQENWK